MKQAIFVTGGNGFIGREICRTAIGAGYEVRALSRTGRPSRHEAWVDMVSWIKGDALDPSTWAHQLEDCTAVIHCIGLIRERPLKGETFERFNAESAIEVAREAQNTNVSTFVMLSANLTPPFVPERFLKSKRHAEKQITEQYQSLRSVFLRPSIVYGSERPSSLIISRSLQALNTLPQSLQFTHVQPLSVSKVAAAAVYAAIHEDVRGVLEEQQIDDLAKTAASSLQMPADTRPGWAAISAGAVVGGLALLWLRRSKK